MASITFSPAGTQLDNDEIADLQVNEGDSLGSIFTLDTSGLDADLQSIKLQLDGDSTEVSLSGTLTDLFGTTFPDVAVVENNSDGDFTFVFTSGEEADIIFDFELGQDAIAKLAVLKDTATHKGIALTSGSDYDSLEIEYNAQGNYTNVSEETGELIATLIGVEADQLTESNFTTI